MSTFEVGTSGNPNGRPKGTGHRQQLFNELVMPHKTALFDKAIELALNGNETMLRLFLERMLPPKPREEPVTLELPENISKSELLLTMGEVILRGISNHDITPSQGKLILNLAEQQRQLFKIKEDAEEFRNILNSP